VVPPRGCRRSQLSADARRILTVQAFRAFAYGLGSVLIGVTLARRDLSGGQVGLVLAALLAGSALALILLARYGDRVGRRRIYRLLLVVMGAAGAVFALVDWLPALLLAAVTGTISTEVLESGPFTSLEQAMLPRVAGSLGAPRLFATYNTAATVAGSLGALAAGGPTLVHTGSADWLLVYPIAAALALPAALSLSPEVEEPRSHATPATLSRSKQDVRRLSALFALDSFGGGFVPQTFVAYLLARRYDASAETIGLVFFVIGLLQAISFQLAGRLSVRIGLVRTMVFTHLPSNVLLAAVAFAPNLGTAVALLFARHLLSQMDVPARQALVVTIVDPEERTAAAAYTNAARYVSRPVAPLIAGAFLRAGLGIPFVLAGALKSLYDLTFFALYRNRGL
jgi:MFS family permease